MANWIQRFLAAIATHKADASAHHAKQQEFFVPVFPNNPLGINLLGHTPVYRCDVADVGAGVVFRVPDDFVTLTKAVFVVIPKSTQAAADWDIDSEYSHPGEAWPTHAENDAATTYNVVNLQLFEIDVAPILTGIEAGHYLAVFVTEVNAAHDFDALGLFFKYT